MVSALKKRAKQEEMNLVPMMNLMTVLIPFLLSITAFAKISTVDVDRYKGGGQTDKTDSIKPPPPKVPPLKLSILVSDQGMTLGARGGFLPTIFTKEQWKFKDDEKNAYYTMDVDSNSLKEMRENRMVNVKEAGREMSIAERQNILLLATDKESPEETGSLVKAIYNGGNEMLVSPELNPVALKDTKVGDTLVNVKEYVKLQKVLALIERLDKEMEEFDKETEMYKEKLTEKESMERVERSINYKVVLTSKDGLIELPCDAYDILLTRLLQVKEQYAGSPDIDEIIITCEDEIVYDKVIRFIDISRLSGFTTVQLGKFRA